MGINYWGIFCFIVPVVAAILLGGILITVGAIEHLKKYKYKIRRVRRCHK